MDTIQLIMLSGMMLVMYFFLMRPQLKKQRETAEMQKGLKKGQRVVTTSGIHGKIVDFNEAKGTISLDLGKTTVQIDRGAISHLETNAKAEN